MGTSRSRELWRHMETGEAYLVEVEEERVVAASGPLTPDQLAGDALAYKHAAQGRTPAFGAETADLQARRHEFERERVEAPD